MQVAQGVYRLTTCYPELERIPLAVFLVVGTDAACLVDAAIPASVERDLRPFLDRVGIDLAEVAVVAVTHGHPDHVGGLAALRALRPDLEIVCSAGDRRWVENHDAMFDELFLRFPQELPLGEDVRRYIVGDLCGPDVRVTRTASADDVIDLGGIALRWIEAPGHSPGHMALYVEREGVLLAGDASQASGIGYVAAASALPPLYESARAYAETQRRLRDIGADVLLGAHHDVQRGPAVADFLDCSIRFVERARVEVERIVSDSPEGATVGDVARKLNERLNALDAQDYVGPLQFLLAASTHLQELESDQAIRRESDRWTAA